MLRNELRANLNLSRTTVCSKVLADGVDGIFNHLLIVRLMFAVTALSISAFQATGKPFSGRIGRLAMFFVPDWWKFAGEGASIEMPPPGNGRALVPARIAPDAVSGGLRRPFAMVLGLSVVHGFP